jgi:hypothetical protein
MPSLARSRPVDANATEGAELVKKLPYPCQAHLFEVSFDSDT